MPCGSPATCTPGLLACFRGSACAQPAALPCLAPAGNAKKLLKQVQEGEKDYHFIEVRGAATRLCTLLCLGFAYQLGHDVHFCSCVSKPKLTPPTAPSYCSSGHGLPRRLHRRRRPAALQGQGDPAEAPGRAVQVWVGGWAGLVVRPAGVEGLQSRLGICKACWCCAAGVCMLRAGCCQHACR